MKSLLMITISVSLTLLLGISLNSYAEPEQKTYIRSEASANYQVPREASEDALKAKEARFLEYKTYGQEFDFDEAEIGGFRSIENLRAAESDLPLPESDSAGDTALGTNAADDDAVNSNPVDNFLDKKNPPSPDGGGLQGR